MLHTETLMWKNCCKFFLL